LLWSVKPGEVQGVGRNTDSAEVLREWEKRTHSSLRESLGATYDDVKRQLEAELGSRAKVLLVQATCPILPGDSGGPLLRMNGDVAGVNDFYRSDEHGGHANYFIHAQEVRDFVKDKPTQPLTELPGFWEAEAQSCKIQDMDGDGKPDTIALFQGQPSGSKMRGKLMAIGWDLNEESDLEKFKTSSDAGSDPELDADAIYEKRAMHLQAYVTKAGDLTLMAYDLNNDGVCELVRIDRIGDGSCQIELTRSGAGQSWRKSIAGPAKSLALRSEEVPAQWRERYEKAVLGLLKH